MKIEELYFFIDFSTFATQFGPPLELACTGRRELTLTMRSLVSSLGSLSLRNVTDRLGGGSVVPADAFNAALADLLGSDYSAAAARELYSVLCFGASTAGRQEVIAGLSAMCTRDHDAVVDVVFAAFDSRGVGELTLDEMTSYLRVVLSLTARLQGGGQAGVEAAEVRVVADQMTRGIFDSIDLDHSSSISRAEFEVWSASLAPPLDEAALKATVTRLRETLRATALPAVVTHICGGGRRGGGSRGNFASVDRADFTRVITELCAAEGGLTAATVPTIARYIFDTMAFSTSAVGVGESATLATKLPRSTVIAGMSAMCGGNHTAITDAVFSAFDADHSNSLEVDEIHTYLQVVFVLVVRLRGLEEGTETIGGVAEEGHKQRAMVLAQAAVVNMFKQIDTDGNHRISRAEFASFLDQIVGKETEAEAAVEVAAAAPPNGDSHLVASVAQIAMLRNELQPIALPALLDALFGKGGGAGGEVKRSTFMRALGEKLDPASRVTHNTVTFLWHTMAHAAGVADAAAIGRDAMVAALSTLCLGDYGAIAACVFAVFDSDHNGTLELNEIRRYLHVVLLLHISLASEVSEGGDAGDAVLSTAALDAHSAKAQRLAKAVIETQFAAIDVDNSGTITSAEFEQWLAQQRDPPHPPPSTTRASEAQGGGDAAAAAAAKESGEYVRVTSDGIARLRAALQVLSLPTLLDALFEAKTEVDAVAFVQGVSTLVPRDAAVDRDVLSFLFSALSHSSTQANVTSLDRAVVAAALSTMCVADHSAITSCVFTAYDADHSGTLELEEARHYLEIVFRTTLGLNICAAAGVDEMKVALQDVGQHSIEAEKMAAHFVSQMFAKIDVDGSGTITKSEFEAWLTSVNASGGEPAAKPEDESPAAMQTMTETPHSHAPRPPPPSSSSLRARAHPAVHRVLFHLRRLSLPSAVAAVEATGISATETADHFAQCLSEMCSIPRKEVEPAASSLLRVCVGTAGGSGEMFTIVVALSMLCVADPSSSCTMLFNRLAESVSDDGIRKKTNQQSIGEKEVAAFLKIALAVVTRLERLLSETTTPKASSTVLTAEDTAVMAEKMARDAVANHGNSSVGGAIDQAGFAAMFYDMIGLHQQGEGDGGAHEISNDESAGGAAPVAAEASASAATISYLMQSIRDVILVFAKQTFSLLDDDKSGKLDRSEASEVFSTESWRELLAEADMDGDAKLDEREWVQHVVAFTNHGYAMESGAFSEALDELLTLQNDLLSKSIAKRIVNSSDDVSDDAKRELRGQFERSFQERTEAASAASNAASDAASDAASARARELEEQLLVMSRQLAEAESARRATSVEKSELEVQLRDEAAQERGALLENVATLESEKVACAAQVASLMRLQKKVSKERDALLEKLALAESGMEEKIASLERSNEQSAAESSAQISALEAQLEQVEQTAVHEVEGAASELHSSELKLRAAAAQARGELLQQLASLQGEKADLAHQVSTLQLSHTQSAGVASARIAELESAQAELLGRVSGLESDNADSTAKIAALRLQSDEENTRTSVTNSTEISELESERTELRIRVASLENENARSAAIRDDAEAALANAEARQTEIANELSGAEEKMLVARDAAHVDAAQIVMLQAALHESEESVMTLRNSAIAATAAADAFTTKVGSLEGALTEARTRSDAKDARFNEMNAQLTALEDTRSREHLSDDEEKRELESDVRTLRMQLATNEASLQSSARDLADAQREHSGEIARCAAIESERASAIQERDGLASDLAATRQERRNDAAAAENATLKLKLTLESERDELRIAQEDAIVALHAEMRESLEAASKRVRERDGGELHSLRDALEMKQRLVTNAELLLSEKEREWSESEGAMRSALAVSQNALAKAMTELQQRPTRADLVAARKSAAKRAQRLAEEADQGLSGFFEDIDNSSDEEGGGGGGDNGGGGGAGDDTYSDSSRRSSRSPSHAERGLRQELATAQASIADLRDKLALSQASIVAAATSAGGEASEGQGSGEQSGEGLALLLAAQGTIDGLRNDLVEARDALRASASVSPFHDGDEEDERAERTAELTEAQLKLQAAEEDVQSLERELAVAKRKVERSSASGGSGDLSGRQQLKAMKVRMVQKTALVRKLSSQCEHLRKRNAKLSTRRHEKHRNLKHAASSTFELSKKLERMKDELLAVGRENEAMKAKLAEHDHEHRDDAQNATSKILRLKKQLETLQCDYQAVLAKRAVAKEVKHDLEKETHRDYRADIREAASDKATPRRAEISLTEWRRLTKSEQFNVEHKEHAITTLKLHSLAERKHELQMKIKEDRLVHLGKDGKATRGLIAQLVAVKKQQVAMLSKFNHALLTSYNIRVRAILVETGAKKHAGQTTPKWKQTIRANRAAARVQGKKNTMQRRQSLGGGARISDVVLAQKGSPHGSPRGSPHGSGEEEEPTSRSTHNPLAGRRADRLTTTTEISPHLPLARERRRADRHRTPRSRGARGGGDGTTPTPTMVRSAQRASRAKRSEDRAKQSADKRAARKKRAEELLARRSRGRR